MSNDRLTAVRPTSHPFCTEHAWADAAAGRLMRCVTCEAVASSPVPQYAYDAGYFTDGATGGYDFNTQFAQDFDTARFLPELLAFERSGLTGSLLDVGCATGAYLTHAQAFGWRVAGVESAAFGRREAARRTNAPVVARCEDLPAGAVFDVVTLHHVLEHVHDPVAFLRDSVAPRVGRLLLVEVPNFDSLASRTYGAAWGDLRHEQHVWHYTAPVLGAVLERAGFRVTRTYSLWQPLWSLRATVTLAELVAGALARTDRRWEEVSARAIGDSAREQAAYRRPSGLRRLAVPVSRWVSRPLVGALEARGLGERLVVEAQPGGAS